MIQEVKRREVKGRGRGCLPRYSTTLKANARILKAHSHSHSLSGGSI